MPAVTIETGAKSYEKSWASKMAKLSSNGTRMEDRPGQAKYAAIVATTLEEGGHLIIEGPCGTGKGAAYLIPLIERLRQNPYERAVVSTAGLALQSQLITKDIPLAMKVVGEVEFALLKGKGNYVCPNRLKLTASRTKYQDILTPIKAQLDTMSGFVDEFNVPDACRSLITGDADDCEAQECAAAKCFYFKAREKALKAQLLVVNHHLLMQHILIEQKTSHLDMPIQILGGFDFIIVDEAHELPNIARSVLGFRLTPGRFDRIAGKYERLFGGGTESGNLRQIGDMVHAAAQKSLGPESKGMMLKAAPWIDLGFVRDTFSEILDRASNGDSADAAKLTRNTEALLSDTEHVFALHDPEGVVYWPERGKSGRCGFEARLLKPAPVLQEFWSGKSVVTTSATMDVGDRFRFISSELGLSGAKTLKVESPFDFKKQARWMIPPNITVQPNDPSFRKEALQAVRDAALASDGRMLALFTSYAALKDCTQYLRKETDLTVFVQGEAPVPQLIEKLKSTQRAVLLGTSSLWTGVDIPGEALSVLLIDRIPFPVPTEPIMAALSKQDPKNAFRTQSMPRAFMQAKQGVGRLIRSKADRGVIVYLDLRIVKQGYGKELRECMPYMPRLSEVSEIRTFLEEGV